MLKIKFFKFDIILSIRKSLPSILHCILSCPFHGLFIELLSIFNVQIGLFTVIWTTWIRVSKESENWFTYNRKSCLGWPFRLLQNIKAYTAITITDIKVVDLSFALYIRGLKWILLCNTNYELKSSSIIWCSLFSW